MFLFIAVATSIFLFIAWRRECRQLNKKINDLFINPQFIKEKTEICIKQKSNNQGSEDKKVYNSAKSDIPVFPRQELEDAIRGVDPTDIPLHRFDSILGLDGKLVDLERACDPDSKRAERFIGEWNGRKSPTLEGLMDSCDGYGTLSQFLVYPKEYLEEIIMDKSLTFSESQAFLINEFFHFISRASIKWDKTKRDMKDKYGGIFSKNKFGNFAVGDLILDVDRKRVIATQKID